MAKAKQKASGHTVYHRDGSLWAKGQMAGGKPTGYWEWFRKDGTKLRSGHFAEGEQVGEWTTYDQKGKVFKVTLMKVKGTKSSAKKKAAEKVPTAKKAAKKTLAVRKKAGKERIV